jgi:hypothetical protein
VAAAWVVTGPARLPVTVRVATPPLAVADPRPVTDPLPAVLLNVTLALLSAPLVTGFPAASAIVAVNVRVAPEARSAVEPDITIWVADPADTFPTERVLAEIVQE